MGGYSGRRGGGFSVRAYNNQNKYLNKYFVLQVYATITRGGGEAFKREGS